MDSSKSYAKQFNIMTIDLEEWFHANYEEGLFDINKDYAVRVVENTARLLALFEKYCVKATFFVLASEAEKHPELIKEIASRGHEVASHGYGHQLVYNQTKEEFREDLSRSLSIIKGITGTRVKGYRAPSWSIKEENKWAWSIMKDEGLLYDSSVFPIQTYLYGMPSAPRFIFSDISASDFKIIPMSTFQVGQRRIPFSGGAYFRLLPSFVIKKIIKYMNSKNEVAIIYLHPREIDKNQPRLKLKLKDALIHYYGVSGCYSKLERILKANNFTSIENYYGL